MNRSPRHTAPQHRQTSTLQDTEQVFAAPLVPASDGRVGLSLDGRSALEVTDDGALTLRVGVGLANLGGRLQVRTGRGLSVNSGVLAVNPASRVETLVEKGGGVASVSYNQAQQQKVMDRLNEVIDALRRAGLMKEYAESDVGKNV